MPPRKPKPKPPVVDGRRRPTVVLTLDPETIEAIDLHWSKTPTIDSRSAAVRDLVRIATRKK